MIDTTLTMFPEDFYEFFLIDIQADSKTIHSAYHDLFERYKNRLSDKYSQEVREYYELKIVILNTIYSRISDLTQKESYDLTRSVPKYPIEEFLLEFECNKNIVFFDLEDLRQGLIQFRSKEILIEENYILKKKEINQLYCNQSHKVNCTIDNKFTELGYNKVRIEYTILAKIKNCTLLTLSIFTGLYLITIGGFISYLICIPLIIIFSLSLWTDLDAPVVSERRFKEVTQINKQIEEINKLRDTLNGEVTFGMKMALENAEKDRDYQLELMFLHRRERIEFFYSLSIQHVFECNIISSLDNEDKLYLLSSMTKRIAQDFLYLQSLQEKYLQHITLYMRKKYIENISLEMCDKYFPGIDRRLINEHLKYITIKLDKLVAENLSKSLSKLDTEVTESKSETPIISNQVELSSSISSDCECTEKSSLKEDEEFDNHVNLEEFAINSAVISADYVNNPEIFCLELKLTGSNIKRKNSHEKDEAKFYNNWYLEINSNEGSASSYSLNISLFFDSRHLYHMIEITCGLKTSYDQNGTLENLMLLGFPKTTSEGIYFSWAIPSLWYSENSEADQRISFHNRIISKVRPVERIIEVTENFATILGISLLHLNNRTIKKMDKISTKGTLFYDSFEMFYDVIGDPLLLYKVQDKDGQWWNADEWDKKIEEYHLSCCPSCETDDFVEILYSDGVLNLRHCKDCELNF